MKISIKKNNFLSLSLILSIVFAILLIGILVITIRDFKALINIVQQDVIKYGISYSVIIIFFVQFIGIIFHELIHAIFSIYFTKDIKAVKFGFNLQYLIFYCQCKKPLYVNKYVTMVIAPFVILGLIPFILGIFFLNPYFIAFGFFFSVVAIGDLYIFYLIIKNYRKKYVMDSADEIGGYYVD